MKLSLHARLTLLGMGPLVCVGVLAATALVVLTNLEIGKQTEQDAKEMSASLSSFVAAKEHHLQLETNLLAEVPYLKSVALMDFKDSKLRSEVYDTVKSNLDHYSHFLDTDGLLLVNDDGKVWVGSGILTGHEGQPLPSFGVDRALNEKVPWSGIVEFDNKLILAATAPLVVGNISKGALICYMQVGASTASELGKSLGTEVAFITRNGTMANSMGLDWILIPKSGLARITIKGEEYVGRPVSLAGTGEDDVHVVALRDVSEIVGQAKGAFVIVFLILAAAMLVASLAAGRFSARLTKPIDTLVSAVRSLETGEWPDEIPASGNDEIGELQRAFNRMVHSLQDQQTKLVEMLDKDPLTELMNHRKFKEVADQLLARAEERKQPAAMLLFDVDGFAEYNRQNGLLAGEEVLKTIARRLRDRAPEGAVVSRYGGDSYAILMVGISMEEASELGAELLNVLGFDRSKAGLTMSGGSAELTPSTNRAESLSLAAELALSKAKQLGRHRICNFDSLVEGAQSDPFQLSQFVQNATLSTIQALAAAVDAKDPYTQGHSQRVAEYASELCRRIGGTDEEVELVYRTGTLHDVGKIGIPDHILQKQGPLEPQERAMMETHPALGELIVQKVPHLQDTLPGVRNHHERWDGKGYPDGLSKEAIPRLGRILAVADTFDAMTSDRPYRKGMAVETAIAEIRRNAGLQFDPEMALEFVRMIAEKLRAEAA